jgi:hypothetical protein
MKSGSVKALGPDAEGLTNVTLEQLLGGVKDKNRNKEKKEKKNNTEEEENDNKKKSAETKKAKKEKKEKKEKEAKRKKRKEGWLVKEGGVYHNWNRRWFVLVDEAVYYFKDAQPNTSLSGVIRLQVPYSRPLLPVSIFSLLFSFFLTPILFLNYFTNIYIIFIIFTLYGISRNYY